MKCVGIIGLGKMGFPIATNLKNNGFESLSYDTDRTIYSKLDSGRLLTADSLDELIAKLAPPRAIMILVPCLAVPEVFKELKQYLSPGDCILDMSNSFFRLSQSRAKDSYNLGIHYLDVGISGGIEGASNGACLMIGGHYEIYKRYRELFKCLAKGGSYQYLGSNGCGHLVKNLHNLAEYGMLQALSESLALIKAISDRENLNIQLTEVSRIWNKGSIVESRLCKDLEKYLEKNPELSGLSGSVEGQTQQEMEEVLRVAKLLNIDVPVSNAAVSFRKNSTKNPSFVGKLINAARNVFGGHEEWKKHI